MPERVVVEVGESADGPWSRLATFDIHLAPVALDRLAEVFADEGGVVGWLLASGTAAGAAAFAAGEPSFVRVTCRGRTVVQAERPDAEDFPGELLGSGD